MANILQIFRFSEENVWATPTARLFWLATRSFPLSKSLVFSSGSFFSARQEDLINCLGKKKFINSDGNTIKYINSWRNYSILSELWSIFVKAKSNFREKPSFNAETSHDSIQSESFNQYRWQLGESNASVWSKHSFMSFHGWKPPRRRAPLISINSHRAALTWQISLDGSPLTCNSTRRLTLGLQPSFQKKKKVE